LDSETGDRGEHRVVPIVMQHREVVTKGAGGYEAVDAGAHCVACAPRGSVELNSLAKDFCSQWGLNNRHCFQGVAGQRERALVHKPLKNFLDDGQTGDYAVEFDESLQAY